MFHRISVALTLALAMALPAVAQNITSSDIQQLQDSVYQAGNEVSQLRSRDGSRAGTLQTELDDLRDEVTYLKVKLRKQGSLTRAEYSDVRDRIDNVRGRARNDGSYSSNSSPRDRDRDDRNPGNRDRDSAVQRDTRGSGNSSGSRNEIPSGTELDVRLSDNLNSGIAKIEDRFEATTLADLYVNDRVVIPAGSVMRGAVTDVQPATRTNRKAQMTVSFDQVTVGNRSYPIRATVAQALEGEGIKGETGRIGAGAGVGAIIGGILGGFKGAMAGILIGGGGTIAATEGKQVEIPQGTTLRVRFDSPVNVGR